MQGCDDFEFIGDPIPGSRFVRDFCRTCFTPIRVQEIYRCDGNPVLGHECTDCGLKHVRRGNTHTEGQRAGMMKTG